MLIDGIDLTSLVLRGFSFVMLLQAAGLALFMTIFATHMAAMPALAITLRKVLSGSAVAALLLVLAQQLLQAGRMSGEWQGVLDLSLQHMTWFSSGGAAALICLLGLVLLLTFVRREWFGASLICGSFLLMGHTAVHGQRSWLALLLAVHLVVVACWFGALLPLYLASRRELPPLAARLTAGFSRYAIWSVPLIALAGVAMALLLLPDWQSVLRPYGLLLLAKLSGFALLMVLAAMNKWRWGMQLQSGPAGVHQAFQRSVLSEYVVIIMVLLLTAVMTGWYSPD